MRSGPFIVSRALAGERKRERFRRTFAGETRATDRSPRLVARARAGQRAARPPVSERIIAEGVSIALWLAASGALGLATMLLVRQLAAMEAALVLAARI